jgi:CubicO group peptidase (beta-lactamase class C family)
MPRADHDGSSPGLKASTLTADERALCSDVPAGRPIVRLDGMQALRDAVDEAAARTGFCGVVRVDRSGETELASAYGFADRAHRIRNTVETQFGIASGTKGLTALAVMGLVERERFELGTTARSLLGGDLPLIADDVTIEHLLAHRSGIGDYLDEDALDAISDYVMPVPVHQLATTEQYLSVLGGHETVFPAGERFAYNNGGLCTARLAGRTRERGGLPPPGP